MTARACSTVVSFLEKVRGRVEGQVQVQVQVSTDLNYLNITLILLLLRHNVFLRSKTRLQCC